MVLFPSSFSAVYSSLSLDTGNARPPSIPQPPLRVPPLKIKVPRPEKPTKPSVPIVPLDSKFQCALKLNRVNLSLYDISNLPDSSQIKRDKLNESSKPTDSINNKTKSFNITKPHEHHKPLKRLNNSETKKQSSPPSEIFKEKRSPETISIRSSTSDVAVIFTKDKTNKRSLSISSMSPTYTPKLAIQKRTGLFKNRTEFFIIFNLNSRKNDEQKESSTTYSTT
jgi:hypothetical protein